MRKSLLFLFIFMLTSILSGCILSKSPTTDDVTMNLGDPMTFSVEVFPPATYEWILDGAPLTNLGKSYAYTAEAGDHILTVKAKHIFGTDTQTWNILINQYSVTTFAGTAGLSGSADGTVSEALFNYPTGLAMDSIGNMYLADYWNHTIRKITPSGMVTTFAGTAGVSGSADGTGSEARFFYPFGVAVDNSDNVYVTDDYNFTIRKITPEGVVTTFAGTAGVSGTVDGTGSEARFNWPATVTVDSAGNVYVADDFNHTIRKITPERVVTTFAGTAGLIGSTDGIGSEARFYRPFSVAVDSSDNLYVAEYNHTIRKITHLGVVTTLAGTAGLIGSTDGIGSEARFNYPSGIAVDNSSNVYVSDWGNHTIRKISPDGVVTTIAGTAGLIGSIDGIGSEALFYKPTGMIVDNSGNVYVADTHNFTIRKITQ